ncbi:hypothetical protein SODALDRAFT_201553 [Sodiomyces alkalinus F11]|uniref:Uncharacterized protein n=1 Tax=Sodiomyces alkalinus (strain CBS 110278 / VKM F-3762 / F11) TaxID=1314773 RepID=A0A3N2PSY5_SODAK|nr:hypothetical protein SODALDRAFT_201553 [Sodiomyces alkalinus F11]ROT37633.1 hypothetical protein SODALDRAFT_201553 [Sodiomyces alkalinus F11]
MVEQDTMKEVAHAPASKEVNENDDNISQTTSFCSEASGGRSKRSKHRKNKKNGQQRINQADNSEKRAGEPFDAVKSHPPRDAAEADAGKPAEDQTCSASGKQPDIAATATVDNPRTRKEVNRSVNDNEPVSPTSHLGQRKNNRFPKGKKETSLLHRASVNNLKNAAAAAGVTNPSSAPAAPGQRESDNSETHERPLETSGPPRRSTPSECESTTETWYTSKSRQTSCDSQDLPSRSATAGTGNAAGVASPNKTGEASEHVAAEPVSSSKRAVSMNPRSRNVSVAIPYNLFGRGQAQSRSSESTESSASSQTITPSSSPIKKDESPPLDKKPLPAVWPTPTHAIPSSTVATSAQTGASRQDDVTTQGDTSLTEPPASTAGGSPEKNGAGASRNNSEDEFPSPQAAREGADLHCRKLARRGQDRSGCRP